MNVRGLPFKIFATLASAAFVVTSIMAWNAVPIEEHDHGKPVEIGDLGEVGPFAFMERSGEVVDASYFKGKVWVAGFIFTKCPSVCPMMSQNMAKLQGKLGPKGLRLASFSVDPENDTPEVLAGYAKRYDADADQWKFFTGDKATMHGFIKKRFRLAVGEAPEDERMFAMEVAHSSRLALVGRDGTIRGYFDGTDGTALKKLELKAAKLLESGPRSGL